MKLLSFISEVIEDIKVGMNHYKTSYIAHFIRFSIRVYIFIAANVATANNLIKYVKL